MAKKRTTGLKGSLLGDKVPVNPTPKDISKTEEIVEAIHNPRKEVVKMTIETPKDLYREIKISIARRGMTLKDYILHLIRKDLNQ